MLEKIRTADAVVFGSPIYYNTITSLLHAFYERLFFPYLTYKKGFPTLVTNRMKTACVYTMNVTERDMLERGYRDNLRSFERYLELYFSKPGLLYAFNTCQFDDYSKYVCGAFSGEEKMAYRTEFFPKDCEAAYALGLNLLK
ncbi:NAD(P)H-dependent oxidoreductase [Alistipes putredinis]|uniref:NAD(P)H-dependent oxidoreductase n=1 Tax=Alistipes putredinis TaxID=28117 RepID=UPI003995678E